MNPFTFHCDILDDLADLYGPDTDQRQAPDAAREKTPEAETLPGVPEKTFDADEIVC